MVIVPSAKMCVFREVQKKDSLDEDAWLALHLFALLTQKEPTNFNGCMHWLQNQSQVAQGKGEKQVLPQRYKTLVTELSAHRFNN
jgi:hypothetical protein